MSTRTALRISKTLRVALGAHHRLNYDDCPSDYHDQWERLRHESENADRQLRYLVRYLASRHDAEVLARACKAPGYINFR